ncbi:MAG TPA: hypothetical protein VK470_12775, partial [Bacteroidota bacterium]|nr:hypothetical protein [Bacteroidota bacterium]
MTTLRILVAAGVLCCLIGTHARAQQQYFIDPNKGNIVNTKQGIMDGNYVRTIFFNHGEIAHFPDQPSGEWPKGTGHSYVDGISIIVQAEVADKNGKIIHPLETNYREFIRTDPVTKIPWGWEPLPGYANEAQNEPAMSNKPSTWPRAWPDRSPEWSGLWNGYFGRSIFNADLETYFRMDDAADQGYPDYRPDPADPSRGGLGLQVAVRGFQWSQVLAADVIFWYYEITNIAKADHTKTMFAQYVDWGIGGTQDSSDDQGAFDTQLDIAYAYDGDGIGQPGNWSPVGYAGYAFLESPGIAFKADGSPHGVDDDQDGITDELRDNDAGTRIAGADNIKAYIQSHYNVQNFLRFYNLQSLDDLPAVQQGYWWTGDENANWRGYLDVNSNGIHDAGEPLNNDVGSDGLGPYDAAYTGPDPDRSEGDGKPEQGEPNFGRLDKDESDQIGLTGFTIFPVHFYELHDDEQNWTVLTTKTDPASVLPQNNVNLAMYFAAGARPTNGFPGNLFPLKQLQTERFSMALLFGIDKNDLVRRKQTVQQIYNANYTFATPPDKPIVTAVAGDRKVTLYWDDKAERSFDRFLQKFDFEGYRIYKSTEPSFLENLTITDAYGKATFHKPVAQYDLVDSIKGLHPLDINGVKFDLGTDSGLRHSFVDTDVQNGQTYYYAVVSYDQGFYTRTAAGTEAGITPSESPAIIRADLSGNVKLDVNTATVTPRAPSAGYVAPAIEGQILHAGPGTGHIDMRILNPDSVRDGHAYRVTFSNPTPFQTGNTPTFSMIDETAGKLLFSDRKVISAGEEMPIVNGMIGYVFNDATVDILGDQTKWIAGTQNTITNVALDPSYTTTNIAYPADYEVRFSPDISDTSVTGLFFGAPPATPVKFTVWNTTENKKTKFLFFDENN